MLHKTLIALAAIAGVGFSSGSVEAALFSYSFQGVIDTSDSSFPANFQPGQTFAGEFTVDASVVPNQPNNGEQFVYEALTSFSVDFGGYVATKTGNPGEEVQVDVHGGPQSLNDRYAAVARGVTGGDIGGFTIGSIVSLVLFTSQGEKVLPGFTAADSSPPLPTDLSGFNLAESGFFLSLDSAGVPAIQPLDGVGVAGHLTDLQPVPEPGSLLLAGLGLMTCGGAWLRRRRVIAA